MDHEATQLLAHVQHATTRLLADIAILTDAEARQPSPLPGWTRGHVLTHLARNADAIGNILLSARTGTHIPMYTSPQAREAAIEAGAGRPARELFADVRTSAAALEEAAALMPQEAWARTVTTHRGELPARTGLLMRLTEVEVHHVDLDLQYPASDWPDSFPALQLPRIAAAMSARDDAPACVIEPDGGGALRIAPPGATAPPVTVSGPGWALLAWLLSRAGGEGLRVRPQGPPPRMPAW